MNGYTLRYINFIEIYDSVKVKDHEQEYSKLDATSLEFKKREIAGSIHKVWKWGRGHTGTVIECYYSPICKAPKLCEALTISLICCYDSCYLIRGVILDLQDVDYGMQLTWC